MHIYIWCQITHIYHSLLFLKKNIFSKNLILEFTSEVQFLN